MSTLNLEQHTKYVNRNLVGCTACYHWVKQQFESKTPFYIPDHYNEHYGKEDFLRLFISFLNAGLRTTELRMSAYEYPKSTRKIITKLIVEHGQFSKTEVDTIFDKALVLSRTSPMEFWVGSKGKKREEIQEALTAPKGRFIRYNLPHTLCDIWDMLGFCPIEVQKAPCVHCGEMIKNWPISISVCSDNLVCLDCASSVDI